MKKKNTLKALLVAAVMFVFSGSAFAQLESSIYFNMGIPVGEFAEDVDFGLTGNMGHLGMGKDAIFGIGGAYRAGYIFDIEVGLIEPFVEAGFNWNRVSSDSREIYEQDYYDGRIPNYFNVPIMAGINYRFDKLSEVIAPYAEFGLGYDLFFTNGEGKDVNLHRLYNYKSSGGFGWQLGIGAIIGKYFSVGANFFSYGIHRMDYTDKTIKNYADLSNNTDVDDRKVSMNTITFRIGFHF